MNRLAKRLPGLSCVAVAFVTAASAGAADWRLADVGDTAAMYVDVDSIRRDAFKVWFWSELWDTRDFTEKLTESRRYEPGGRHLYEADCRMMEYKVIAGKLFNRKLQLWETNEWAGLFPKDFAPPGTLIYAAIDNSCKQGGWVTGAVSPKEDARARLVQRERSAVSGNKRRS